MNTFPTISQHWIQKGRVTVTPYMPSPYKYETKCWLFSGKFCGQVREEWQQKFPYRWRVLLKNCTQSFTNRTFTELLHASRRSTTCYFILFSDKLTAQFKSDYWSKKLLNLKYSVKIVGAHEGRNGTISKTPKSMCFTYNANFIFTAINLHNLS